ncbi:MAG TPA: polysaccharide biosynthesis protein, partial [Clostridiales bacterium]|nr:polysaccharide biosynthesis protein [Clostridiales bacterium]
MTVRDGTRSAYLQGAMLLAGGAMLSRVLGAVYRIPLTRLLGSYGMGLYGAGYTIYVTLLSVATVGINVAISKLMAEKLALGDEQGARRVFVVSAVLLAAVGFIAAAALALAAMPLA